jgi:EAL domain-containing protein (putative c-di-GMP-specific phosphodiesterase class I)
MAIPSDRPTPAVGLERRPAIRSLLPPQLPSVFQPIVDLTDGSIFAHEALVRCKHDAFASPIGLFEHAVAENSCGMLGRMIREGTFADPPDNALFVNLHPHELRDRWLVQPDDPICFHNHQVYLEVTESATLDYYDLCISVLKEVCDRTGAYLVVDDLGAGYSNLIRVVELEPKVVKLDRALITGLDTDKRKQTLVTHLVRLCDGLGAKIVAEGIETLEELKASIDCGAHFGQGYYLARPGAPPPNVRWPFGAAE